MSAGSTREPGRSIPQADPHGDLPGEVVTYRRYELVNADGTPYGATDPRALGGGLWFDSLAEVRAELNEARRRSDPDWDPYQELTLLEVVEKQRPIAQGQELRRLLRCGR